MEYIFELDSFKKTLTAKLPPSGGQMAVPREAHAISPHGIIALGVPCSELTYTAEDQDKNPLECQIIPSPHPRERGSYSTVYVKTKKNTRTISLAPAGKSANCVKTGDDFPRTFDGGDYHLSLDIKEGELCLLLNMPNAEPLEFFMTDNVDNTPGSDCKHTLYKDTAGKFTPFHDKASLSVISDGPMLTCYELTGPLVDISSGEALGDALITYRLVFFKNLNIISLSASYKADLPTNLDSANLFRFKLPKDRFNFWTGGYPEYTGYDFEFTHGFDFPDALAISGEDLSVTLLEGACKLRPGEQSIDIFGMGNFNYINRNIRNYSAKEFTSVLAFGKGNLNYTELCKYKKAVPPLVILGTNQDHGEETTLLAGALEVGFGKTEKGIGLSKLVDHKLGERWLAGAVAEVFTLQLKKLGDRPKYIQLSSLDGWENTHIAAEKNSVHLLFTSPSDKSLEGISVTVSCIAVAERNRVEWAMQVVNTCEKVAVMESSMARLHIVKPRDVSVFLPDACGITFDHVTERTYQKKLSYPSVNGTMQYAAFYSTESGSGIYFGVHDRVGSVKDILFDSFPSTQSARLYWNQVVENAGQPRNSCSVPANEVWELFEGDWYDATEIYREWVLGNAHWIPEMDKDGRVGMPQWLKDTQLWSLSNYDENGKYAKLAKDMQKEFDVPMAMHLYLWHKIPFDNDYPHYFPVRERLGEHTRSLQEAGIPVMPYINGRLWDIRDVGTEDVHFTKTAKPWAVKREDGGVVVEDYDSKESDGSNVLLAVMCPSSAVWQDKQQEINDRILNELSMDGVYLDQVSAAPAVPCYDQNHNHLPGGGSWWNMSYWNLLEHLLNVKTEGKIYTTECNAEPFMKHLDGLLTWINICGAQVPAFSQVYSGYVALFGRSFTGLTFNDFKKRKYERAYVDILQSWLWGEQLGWISPSYYFSIEDREILVRAARARHKNTRFFSAGRMLRPPTIVGDSRYFAIGSYMKSDDVIYSPVSGAAVWEYEDEKLLMLMNIGDEEAELVVRSEYLREGSICLEGDVEGEYNVTHKDGIGEVRIKMPRMSIATAKI